MKQYKITIIADTHSTEFIVNAQFLHREDNGYQFYNKVDDDSGRVDTVMFISTGPQHSVVVEYV